MSEAPRVRGDGEDRRVCKSEMSEGREELSILSDAVSGILTFLQLALTRRLWQVHLRLSCAPKDSDHSQASLARA